MENGSGSLSSPNPLQKIYIHIRGNMLPATSKINVTQSDSNAILASFNVDKLWEQNTLPGLCQDRCIRGHNGIPSFHQKDIL